MTIEELRAHLAAALKIPAALYGFRGGNLKTSAMVLSTTGENAYKGDDTNAERAREVSIDLYVAEASDALPDALVVELLALGLPYRLNVDFQEDTNLRHVEIITEI